MKTLYLDCVGGISGDMFLSALLDLGANLERIELQLKPLLGPTKIIVREVQRGSLRARALEVTGPQDLPALTYETGKAVIAGSGLPQGVQGQVEKVLALLATAEARVHGVSLREVHFHEVGAVDTLVDIVGTVLALEQLEVENLWVSPLPLGCGTTVGAHGVLPLPGPAVLEILKEVPLYGIDWEGETVTPTGAALVKGLATGFGPLPSMLVQAVGYGGGTRSEGPLPNVVRAIWGEASSSHEQQDDLGMEAVEVLETTVDDTTPETLAYVSEQLLVAGALESYLTPVQMKKGRPGCLITVLARPRDGDRLALLLLRETSTLGVRRTLTKRTTLPRRSLSVATPYGPVALKVAWVAGREKVAPEYEDCRRLALKAGVPLREVFDAARLAYLAVPGTRKQGRPPRRLRRYHQKRDENAGCLPQANYWRVSSKSD